MNLIDDYTQRLTHSETDICRCNYCTETRGILTELLDEVEKRVQAGAFRHGLMAEAFKEMREEKG